VRADTTAARASAAPPASHNVFATSTTCSHKLTLGHSTTAQCVNHLQKAWHATHYLKVHMSTLGAQ
jgi:hypothetical protein